MRTCRWPGDGLLFSHFEHANLCVPDRIRVVVHVNRFHIGFAFVEIEIFDMVLLALVDVDRFRMNGR
jgi:hypothetical protein